MKNLIVSVALMLAACGGDEGSMEGKVQGSWFALLNENCGTGLSFSGKEYVYQLVCVTSASPAAAADDEMETGTFEVNSEGAIRLVPQKTTCPDDPISATTTEGTVGFADGKLIFNVPSEGLIVAFERNTEKASSVVLTLGCFEMAGFKPGPLVPVRR